MRIRFGLRLKLLMLSSFLFTIPWFGYQYIWEMEKYLRFGQEQAIIGTAQALATALHERPKLFNNQASFLPSVEKGKDLYGYQLYRAIKLDGVDNDWPEQNERSHYYGQAQQLPFNSLNTATYHNENDTSLHFNVMVGKYEKYVYLFFNVVDDSVIFRQKNALSIINNDYLEIAFNDKSNGFNRYIISNKSDGWVDAYRITNLTSNFPEIAPNIQGSFITTPEGYNIEIRIPIQDIGDKIAFAVNDVDNQQGPVENRIGSADTRQADSLGTILVPSTEIERIVKGMSYTHSRIWVVDRHKRVLAKAGNIQNADGVWSNRVFKEKEQSWWRQFEQTYLHPLYYKILNKPANNFVDALYDVSNMRVKNLSGVLQGKVQSNWRLSQDKKAVILSAAYPIFIDNIVHGAVIVEETTNGIRTLRNRAFEKLFSAMLAILVVSSLVFLIFASRISNRIRRLSNQADQAIDSQGRILGEIKPSTVNDEIGDLSRSFASMVTRLSQYNHYLENMSSRLSHELRTPIAVVRTSLENLTLHTLPNESYAYIERAKSGTKRLNQMISDMSEATRLEQMLQATDKVKFDLVSLIEGCISGYQQIFPTVELTINKQVSTADIMGSPEHIAQMLDKLINNAIDFSNDNSITIEYSITNESLQLSISNNGQLLPQEFGHHIFDSMVSIRPQSHNKKPHLGLGLYVARIICDFHQASIEAHNHQQPDGVTITVKFPLFSK